jgi:arylsulfatase A-like enzyme
VIFFYDNGGFGPVTSMAPLRGSKGMLYEGGIRVPLVVRWSTVVPANRVSDEPVIGLDLFPTILDITGTPLPEGQVLDGVSLLPVFRGSETLVQRDLFWHFPAYLQADASVMGPWRTTPASAVRRGNYKLITFFEDGRNELYNLADDLSEAHDLSRVMPDRTNELRAELEQWWRDTGAWLPTEPNELYDPAVHEEKFPQKP